MGVTLAGDNISCPKAPEKEDKLREDGGMNGVKDLLHPEYLVQRMWLPEWTLGS